MDAYYNLNDERDPKSKTNGRNNSSTKDRSSFRWVGLSRQLVYGHFVYDTYVMAGSSRDQGVLLHRGPHQLGAYTSPNKCLAYPRTLYPTEYRPTLAWTKVTIPGFNLDRLFPAPSTD